MIIELEKGDNLRGDSLKYSTIIKNNGERIKISWVSYLKLIDYRMIDEIKSYDYYDRYVVNNHYNIDLEVI